MAGHGRRVARSQHDRLQSVRQPARRPERVRKPSGLQCSFDALALRTHVGATPRSVAAGIDVDDAPGAAHQADELTLGTALPAAEARASRDMPHVPVDGGSASGGAASAGASATGAGSARTASHSSAAA
jgi:hypothetical protein